MTRFERTPTPLVYGAIVLSIGVVFMSDLLTSLGMMVGVLYLLPLVFSYLTWRPLVPVYTAATTTLLILTGFFLSPHGIEPFLAAQNRAFVVGTSWVLAALGYQFITNKLAVRKQEWLQSGQTLLSERMAGDPNLEELGSRILSTVAGYLDAPAGAFFIENGRAFNRVATYGVPADARIPLEIQAGDGLLGVALAERKVSVVCDVPDGYLPIGSSLGRSAARQLFIAPLAVERSIKAVVELGFFHPVGESDKEFMARVSESIAVAIRSAQARAHIQQLLETTQRQAEELQMQSEELRAANEELTEQSARLQDSHARLEEQQAELEQSNAQLEEQTQMLETQKDVLMRAQSDLKDQARELEQAGRYKSQFLANMSHELRTPLNASLILARQLGDNVGGNLTPEQVKYARSIESAGRDLLSLINEVLDLAKVEAGRMEVQLDPVGLGVLIQHMETRFQPMAGEKGLSLRVRLREGLPETIETDQQRLEQVLNNLLSNAIKFTEQGEVALEISRAADGRLAFAVRDTGIGISDDQQQVIFEPFRQADGTTNRKYGGTGLGLSIAREFTRLLGGDIRLSSQPGRGSTFTVLLPERSEGAGPYVREMSFASFNPLVVKEQASRHSGAPPVPALIPDDRERLSGNRRVVLIVEDDEPFAQILYDLAHDQGFHALIATTADEALVLAKQFVPSAILLDISLPDISGLSVLDRLKIDSPTRHIPVHILSVHDYTQTALSLGAVGYILKPVKRDQLIDAFQRLEQRLTQRLRRVLIVEDDAVQREAITVLLASRDVEAVGVGTAADCLDRLRATTFDCMVLDLSLPDENGYALLETLSREDRYSFPPVIIYTGRDLLPDEEQRLRRYAKSIIIKGAKSPERLLDEVTLFLHQVIADLPPEQQAMLNRARHGDAALEGTRLLVVEDDVRNVFALMSLLEPRGAKVQVARNGREALETLEGSLQPDGAPIDLVLMDIMMPEMDGLTAMREIRKRPEWKNLPIIALTAKAMKSDHVQALTAGANDYMAKPLDVDRLLSLVRIWMPKS
ncbi:MAG: Multi-sensor hybrid histidine kinase [Candidatus Nitrospira kreftii]|uniref:histidine kinase n=1 Tax=Candidatus Nitrospira kreftii TaxID=2652173 RepID=A0A7S8IXR5_9BACT|nr:MAG: Multi-sensor hybrid histidine kinase [Candidatus Nitrospira kreftii]